MGKVIETFEQPFLDKVEDVLDKAVSITWEGCHKIYVCLDQASHEQQIEYGYEMVAVEDKAEALNHLYEWWNSSCGLRFINAIEGDDQDYGQCRFHDVIPQFEYDE
jgi:hypothetical protein